MAAYWKGSFDALKCDSKMRWMTTDCAITDSGTCELTWLPLCT